MRNSAWAPLVVTALLLLTVAPAGADITAMFPDMIGWERDGEPAVYLPDNLFEYINGAADLYLAYDFQEMGTLNYWDKHGGSVSVEIYRLGDARCAYGIYSQERPRDPSYVELGAQGYHDPGVLNFCQGDHYVKILGYELADGEKAALTAVANSISAKISSAKVDSTESGPGEAGEAVRAGDKTLPAALSCFPATGKVPNTERYIARDFLGQEFLRSAFVAEYDIGELGSRAFIIEARDADEAKSMVERFRKSVADRGGKVEESDGVVCLRDPRQGAGPVTLKRHGSYVWGVVGDDLRALGAVLRGIEENLKEQQLLE